MGEGQFILLDRRNVNVSTAANIPLTLSHEPEVLGEPEITKGVLEIP